MASDVGGRTEKAIRSVARQQELVNQEIDLRIRELDKRHADTEREQSLMRAQIESLQKPLLQREAGRASVREWARGKVLWGEP